MPLTEEQRQEARRLDRERRQEATTESAVDEEAERAVLRLEIAALGERLARSVSDIPPEWTIKKLRACAVFVRRSAEWIEALTGGQETKGSEG